MNVLSTLHRLARGFRNRLPVRSLHELELVDVGHLRNDVRGSLRRSLLSDRSEALKATCCHWRAYVGSARPVPCGVSAASRRRA